MYLIIIVLTLKDKYENVFNTFFKKRSRDVKKKDKNKKKELKSENFYFFYI